MDLFLAVPVAAAISGIAAAVVARMLRLPWWANMLAVVVSWFGLALQLSLWEIPAGDLIWTSAKLTPLPTVAGSVYAVITRGVIGPPEGPLPRSH